VKVLPKAVLVIITVITFFSSENILAVTAQKVKPGHKKYNALVLDVSSTGGKFSVGFGPLFERSMIPSEIITMPDGSREETTPLYYYHVHASVGTYGFFEDLSVIGSAGIIRRLKYTLINKAGTLIVGSVPHSKIGPVIRAELYRNVGVQLGWMFSVDNKNDDGFFFSVDLDPTVLLSLGIFK
jgi:hypothetical protein